MQKFDQDQQERSYDGAYQFSYRSPAQIMLTLYQKVI